MAIDMRLRPPIPGWKDTRMFAQSSFDYLAIEGFPRPLSAQEGSLDLLLAEMDEAGIETGVVMGRQSPPPFGQVDNEELRRLVKLHPNRFIAWAGLDVDRPMDDILKGLDTILSCGEFRGVSIEPTLSDRYTHAGDFALYPIFERCAASKLPINITLSSPLQIATAQYLEKIRPQYLVQAARDFPRLAFHIGHAAWPWTMEMVAVAIACPNIWVSPDMYLIAQFPGSQDFAKAAANFLADRTLFGSAYPFKPLPETVRAYEAWSFPAHIEQKILTHNAWRLMDM